MSASSSSPEPGTTPDEYRQRALLWADLGRYDDAAEELGAGLTVAPTDAALLATLAKVHLAADQPAEALVAADRAVEAAPDTLDPLIVRGMALADNRRYSDAALVASGILRRWPADPYAQRTGAGLLGESRNGQEALNAAWNGVRIAPADAEAHLVLAVVSARLRLFDLAQRAYGEALDLDERIGDAQRDVGVVRFERRRWALALESLADEASLEPPSAPAGPPPSVSSGKPPSAPAGPPPSVSSGKPPSAPAGPPPSASTPPSAVPPEPGYPTPFPRPYQTPDAAGTAAVGDTPDLDPHPRTRGQIRGRRSTDAATPTSPATPTSSATPAPPADGGDWPGFFGAGGAAVGRRSGPVLDPSPGSARTVRQAVLYGANGTLVAAVLTAGMTLASSGASRVWAGMIGVIVLVAVAVWLTHRLTEPLGTVLGRLRTSSRALAVATYAMFLGPVLIVVYAGVGGPAPLIAAMAVAAAAELLVLARR